MTDCSAENLRFGNFVLPLGRRRSLIFIILKFVRVMAGKSVLKPIHLVLSLPSEKMEQCASRFWGNPDLPEGTDYPMYIDDDGDEYPYFFICQINLAELAGVDADNPLPKTGLLSFFAKIDHYMGLYSATDIVGGSISPADAVKVMYFPSCDNMDEIVLLDEDDTQVAPAEMRISFRHSVPALSDEHILFAPPAHREWETWDEPFEDWEILLQIDSFSGMDFDLNFMDFGVLDFLISPEDLKNRDFGNVRAIVLST